MRALPKTIVFLSVAVVAISLGRIGAQAPQTGKVTARENAAELKLSISAVNSERSDALRLHVTFENVSDNDTVLNLGMMLGNGKVLRPEAFRLILDDANGQSKELRFSDKKHPGVAGRIDDYAVPLRAGSTYTFKLSLNDYWCLKSNEHDIKLNPGRYGVRAKFIGKGADHEQGRLMRFWTGELESEIIHFEIGNQD